jgi:hypothetical protein
LYRHLFVAVECSLNRQTGNFVDANDEQDTGCFGLGRTPKMAELIKEEISRVRHDALEKIISLRGAPDIHCGLECFHLFLLDLLGVSIHGDIGCTFALFDNVCVFAQRESGAAKIFQYKMEEE